MDTTDTTISKVDENNPPGTSTPIILVNEKTSPTATGTTMPENNPQGTTPITSTPDSKQIDALAMAFSALSTSHKETRSNRNQSLNCSDNSDHIERLVAPSNLSPTREVRGVDDVELEVRHC